MRMPQMPKGNNGGFTLVELLVVILIIVILSVTMLPLLKPFVTKAQYAAEGVPVIGNLRTKIELYRIEKDHLPGLFLNNGKVIAAGAQVSDTSDTAQTSTTPQIQSMNDYGQYTEYVSTPPTAENDSLATTEAYHAFKQIDVNYADLTGKRLRPSDMQYVVAGNEGETFLWAVGCFGSGNLAKGCGYAVLEYNNTKQEVKFVATFERYKPKDATQLRFVVSSAPATEEPAINQEVWLPTYADITDAAAFNDPSTLVANLQEAGWDVTVQLK